MGTEKRLLYGFFRDLAVRQLADCGTEKRSLIAGYQERKGLLFAGERRRDQHSIRRIGIESRQERRPTCQRARGQTPIIPRASDRQNMFAGSDTNCRASTI